MSDSNSASTARKSPFAGAVPPSPPATDGKPGPERVPSGHAGRRLHLLFLPDHHPVRRLVAPADTYCGFCGELLLDLSIEPKEQTLISGMTRAAREKTFLLKNDDSRTLDVSIGPASAALPGLVVSPARLKIPAGNATQITARLDEGKLPPRLRVETLDFRAMIDGDAHKSRTFKVTVKAGPRPFLVNPTVQFGRFQEGQSEKKFLEIRNDGGVPLTVRGVTAEGSSQLAVGPLRLPVAIHPGRRLRVPVAWDTGVEEEVTDTSKAGFKIDFGNYKDSLFAAAKAMLYRFRVDVDKPRIRLSAALSKQDYIERVELRNRGTADVVIASIESEEEWIEIASKESRFTLLSPDSTEERTEAPPPGASDRYDFRVICRPRGLAGGWHRGTVTLWTQDQQEKIEIAVEMKVIEPQPFMEYIGIDFGTTNSVISIFNDETNRVELVEDVDGAGKRSPLIPSVLAFVGGPNTYKIGHEARNEAEVYPDRVVRSIKRIMGYDSPREFFGREFQPEQLASLIIKRLVGLAETKFFEMTGNYFDIKKAIVTVPANFYDLQIGAVLVAGAAAGLDVEEEAAREAVATYKEALGKEINAGIILDEPSAAALYYLYHLEQIEPDETLSGLIGRDGGLNLLVFDYGGGTLDVSVTNLSRLDDGSAGLRILANMGNNRLGGDSLDLALMREMLGQCEARSGGAFDASLVRARYKDLLGRRQREAWSSAVWTRVLAARQKWKDLAEEVKIALSDEEQTSFEAPPEVILRLEGGAVRSAAESFSAQITRQRFVELIGDTLDECEGLVESALGLAELEPHDVDYVVHTGRQSLMPAVRERVRQLFPNLPDGRFLLDPEHLKVCVAKGAALYGLMRDRVMAEGAGVKFVNEGRRLPFAYGLEKFVGLMRQEFDAIIPRGTPYPTEETKRIDKERIPRSGRLHLKFYQNSGVRTRIEGNPEIRLVGQIFHQTDPGEACDIRCMVDANRKLEVFVGDQEVKVQAIPLSEEEEWMA